MKNERPEANRRLLPRWHSSNNAVNSGELRSITGQKKLTTSPLVSLEYEQLRLQWRLARSVDIAADILSCATSLCRTSDKEAIEAAQFILSEDDSPELIRLSERLLTNKIGTIESLKSVPFKNDHAKLFLQTQIAVQKGRIRNFPRNALAWMDLARLYTSLGQQDKAKHAVRIATALAPNNRFILRSGARFYVHAHRHEDGDILNEGLLLLRRSSLLKVDPWVMAAEISLSTLSGKAPLSIKLARDLSDSDRYSPWDSSELNGALATLIIFSGGKGNPHKLFNKSLRNPTENALAQAQWASIEHYASKVPENKFSEISLGAPEALALKYRSEKKWTKVIEQCRAWSEMEPTSTRPLIIGSFIAEVALEDGEIALEFAEKACIIAPNEDFSHNNAAVALAYLGRLGEAEKCIIKNSHKELGSRSMAVNLATQGLIAYRRGRIDEGRNLYLKAGAIAKQNKDVWLRAMSMWHMLREESKIGNPEIQILVESLWRKTNNLNIPEIEPLRERILKCKPTLDQRVDQLIRSATINRPITYLEKEALSSSLSD